MTGTPLLVIGSRGFLGSHLAHTSISQGCALLSDDGIDITSQQSVRDAFERLRPRAVILLAAIADIDRCQAEPDLAERVNVYGALRVAEACAASGARLIFTSSGAVFDGLKHGYVEDDPPTPTSVYGETKARAEAAILDLFPSAAVVRLSLVLGFALRPGTNSMLDRIRRLLTAGTPIAAPPEEYRNPIDTGTVSEILLDLARQPASGLFHLGSSDSLARIDLIRHFARHWNYPENLAQPSLESHPGRAPRGRDQFLIPDRIAAVCKVCMPNYAQVIERCLRAAPPRPL